jgi:hypothetical protein
MLNQQSSQTCHYAYFYTEDSNRFLVTLDAKPACCCVIVCAWEIVHDAVRVMYGSPKSGMKMERSGGASKRRTNKITVESENAEPRLYDSGVRTRTSLAWSHTYYI